MFTLLSFFEVSFIHFYTTASLIFYFCITILNQGRAISILLSQYTLPEMYTPSILLLLASAGLIDGRSVFEARHFDSRRLHHLTHKRATHMHAVEDVLEERHLSPRADATTLAANAIQTGSFFDGTTEVGANVAAQAPSLTSQNNFINNCAGKTLTNGLQITTGSCNGISE